MALPNLPHASVPLGEMAVQYLERGADPRKVASISSRSRTGTWGPALGIIDFERATKIAGARFAVLMGVRRGSWRGR